MNEDHYNEPIEYGAHLTPEENITNWQFMAIKQREERVARDEEIKMLNDLFKLDYEEDDGASV